MPRKRRSKNQIKEDISKRIFRQLLPEEWVIHNYSPDYGIDCVVELFDYVNDDVAETLGETFYVQLKSSSSIKYETRKVFGRSNVSKFKLEEDKTEYIEIEIANFQLEVSELLTIQAMGPAIPVLLILVDTKTERTFFICLNDYIDKIMLPEDSDLRKKNSKSIHIPLKNEITTAAKSIIPLRVYGKRSKMYGAFSRFHYQKKEIERILGKAAHNPQIDTKTGIEIIEQFVESSLNQDIWKGHGWDPIKMSYKELTDIQDQFQKGLKTKDYPAMLNYANDTVWHKLTNMSHIYEEIVREWFLPTFLAQLLSYESHGEIKKE